MGQEEGAIRKLKDLTRFNPARQVHITRYPETPDSLVFIEKIHSAFHGVKSFPYKRIYFQLWRVETEKEDGRLVLESYRNPYAKTPFDPLGHKYRSRCVKYRYRVHEGDNNHYPFKILSGGLPVAAYRNCFPEVVTDLSVHQRSPLEEDALDCDLKCCMMLPIFHHHSSQCVGVVECSMKRPADLLVIFNEMKRELERQELSIYHVQGSWPYKTIIGDLDPAMMEIKRGLEIACESHELTLGQVWISYESKNDHHVSDSADQMKQNLLVKLSGYCVDSNDDPLSSVKDFYDKLDVVALKEREGLVWKTLQTRQPYLCRNIYKLNDNRGILGVLSATNIYCACFVICLRSTHTGELDYAFEFFWPQGRNHLILLETVLLTLRRYLPSFEFASGEQLGDEIYVVDASLGKGNTPLKIPQENQISETSKETCSLVGVKRMAIHLSDCKSDEDDDDLPILAFYRGDVTLFYLPVSSTFENLRLKLEMEFKLDSAADYKVEHEVSPGKWRILECLESCRGTVKDTSLIKLRLVGVNGEVAWQWKTN